ncbi:unnamed protein product (macronuclear) [Paramecium tetraurelia]|uniref:Protein kinase domain-containing protein n=1 Tax=Paramecium tetraurelia TaxID=5888 RepID=A0DBJ9_PARTE|nr:uncharacterized protein GSPATT00015312001 [Paramecium tetraurelia]CAK80416.1 unnamed protein product [Paramecium tetraurelia]|eukprot:XP_001447813.1 hypothetical protein (macronuclear) [Paramecium tetraurelia strain d4-2]
MQQNYSYTKIKCLFKGYAGKVFLIEQRSENDPPNKQTVPLVLKRYYRKASDPENHTNLIEYQLLTSLQHPNIINIVDAFTEQYEYKKYLCLTMEYMAPLHEIIGNLKDYQLYIFKEICQAVSYLHSNNILHRDIKPSNILVTTQGRVKLGDFGISTKIRQSMTPQTCTKNYRAPELFFGLKEYDHSIDIWSLGCTLIELFTGKMLFNGTSEIEIMSQIAELLGSVNEQNWEGVSQLPMFLEFVYDKQPLLDKVIGRLPIQVQSLVIKLLQLNPKGRLKINEILSIQRTIIYCTEYFKRQANELNLNYYMNFDYPKFEFQTLQKAIFVRTYHKHNSSQSAQGHNVRDAQGSKTSFTKVGQESLRQWDFFSDPYSLPDKCLYSLQKISKTESSELDFDSLDFMLRKNTERHSSKSFQSLNQETHSEKLLGKKVHFSNSVSVKNDDGSESEDLMRISSRQKTRKSNFSKKFQMSFIQD